MASLKHSAISVMLVNSFDFETFVKNTYGVKDYYFVAVQECNNDSHHLFKVDGKIDKWDEEEAKKIIETKDVPCYTNRLLFQMLCRDGHIPQGYYLVEVSW